MTGEKDLDKLLRTMSPGLREEEYVFCTFPYARYGDHSNLKPIASFMESEGLTLVISKSEADMQGFDYGAVFKCITLNVHSSLEAVGLTAAFSKKLAEHGISVNVTAAYYHDHIFVQSELAEQAMSVLNSFSNQ